jgi:hypothetical protein
MTERALALFKEEPAKLIVNRRAIAAGLAALISAPASAAVAKLQQLTNVPLAFNPADFSGSMQDGIFLPDYRHPMVRIVFNDGSTTNWHRYTCLARGPKSTGQASRPIDTHACAIETCAPDKNGSPRYTQLAIG